MSGWFAVKRGITSHALFKGKPERLAVWLWLLDNAVWKDTTHDVKGHTVNVPRGSVCVSERHISEACGVGYQVVRTAIKRFKTEHMINAQPTHGKSMISLCNYEKYQDPKGEANAEVNATLTQRQRNPNAQKEQGNKGTREKGTNVPLAIVPSKPKTDGADFAEFWDRYPRKVGKDAARKAFAKAMKAARPDDVMFGLSQQLPSLQSKDPQFIPHAASWLNQGRWTDEPEQPNDDPRNSAPDATTRAISIASRFIRTPSEDCF
jgi:hypothetical protein